MILGGDPQRTSPGHILARVEGSDPTLCPIGHDVAYGVPPYRLIDLGWPSVRYPLPWHWDDCLR